MERIPLAEMAQEVERAPDGVVGVTVEDRIVLINRRAERIFGYQTGELTGQPGERLVPEGHRGRYQQQRAAVLAGTGEPGETISVEAVGLRKDGSTFPAVVGLARHETDTGPITVATVHDLSGVLARRAERERKVSAAELDQLEAAARQSSRLEALGQLAGGVAHDFNNQLGVISSYAAFISDEASKDPARIDWRSVREDIRQVQEAARRAAGLTRQLLDFAGRRPVQPQTLDLTEIITELTPMLNRTLGEHIQLTTSLGSELPAVLADRSQVEDALVNLVVNARDAMPEGGQLTIGAAGTQLDQSRHASRLGLEPGRYARVTVRDTGSGMPQEVIDHAFEPFFTTKPHGSGSGLGLATVYGIVTQAGGNVGIQSRPGFGTTITILLPEARQAAPAEPAPGPDAADGHGETVLVVEDDDAKRAAITRMLGRHGYRALPAADGREAMALASGGGTRDLLAGARRHVDVLLTDVELPGMQGGEVADRVSALQPGVRVVYTSGYSPDMLTAQGRLKPGTAILEKPFDAPTLLETLHRVLTGAALAASISQHQPARAAPPPRWRPTGAHR